MKLEHFFILFASCMVVIVLLVAAYSASSIIEMKQELELQKKICAIKDTTLEGYAKASIDDLEKIHQHFPLEKDKQFIIDRAKHLEEKYNSLMSIQEALISDFTRVYCGESK